MAAELIAPTDELTGLPYPIAPKCEPIPEGRPDIADIHHGFHKERDLAGMGLPGIALRNCWKQLVERDLHNEGPGSYHRFYDKTELPAYIEAMHCSDKKKAEVAIHQFEAETFGRVVLACAGVIPRKVIDLSSGEPVERDMTCRELKFLCTPNPHDSFGYKYITYSYDPIREFLVDYVVRQDLRHLTQSRLDEFLETKDSHRKMILGKMLLKNAAAVASDGDTLKEKYKILKREGRVHPAMPPDPQTLVTYKLNMNNKLHNLVWKLQTSILESVYNV